ncbi:2-amino-4-hydroxy-6-hydroxymethyldihydropteridine diphosphokinase [Aquibium sp. A9E412]|uniref:2-amino-4-hydroxy-6- hydroxymethyldihydropteridine diphosphokinase n=1 Tax=Aquibium sp. A9E412 TaxID=2976767 RepID=UPI0025AFF8B7|nr:2-amino-4-hydroxy-6-hydroxymethyldihydropteridine diphosphokinase [Aquibium sp. A9E412]MDN2568277.1 2-amino-4-hydroxy-6-hydroxymethyldihydropteridine diphosphokinase [Aquibium sp. A9E412]
MSGRNSPVAAYLGLGGNLGDPAAAMATALRRLDAHAAITVAAVSSLYRTPPWGKTDQPDFLNAVARLDTHLAPRALLEALLAVERGLDRVRGERWGPRPIDLDILLHGTATVAEPGLSVPHPRMLERAFVLLPLAEIAPDLRVAGAAIAAHAARVDASGVVRLPGGGDWWRKKQG